MNTLMTTQLIVNLEMKTDNENETKTKQKTDEHKQDNIPDFIEVNEDDDNIPDQQADRIRN